MSLNIITHPLVQHKLTLMRDVKTSSKDFRELLYEMTILMFYEVAKDFKMDEASVETPFKICKGHIIKEKICFVPILRAGLIMCEAVLKVMPDVKVGHIGMSRDETTFEPLSYYSKLPSDISERTVILLDPMLATGGSTSSALKFLRNKDVKSIRFLGIVGAPEGVKALQTAEPDLDIYLASVDEGLNEKAYIIPGLGDAGDRFYGTH